MFFAEICARTESGSVGYEWAEVAMKRCKQKIYRENENLHP